MKTSWPSARRRASVSADRASITGAMACQSVSAPMLTSVSGPTSLPSGARKRASASKPATASVSRRRIGWKTGSTLLSPCSMRWPGFGGDEQAARETAIMEGAEEVRRAAVDQRDADVDRITGTAGFQRRGDAHARETIELVEQRLQRPAAIELGQRAARFGANRQHAFARVPRPQGGALVGSGGGGEVGHCPDFEMTRLN